MFDLFVRMFAFSFATISWNVLHVQQFRVNKSNSKAKTIQYEILRLLNTNTAFIFNNTSKTQDETLLFALKFPSVRRVLLSSDCFR